jgi:hypothetical protein
LLLLLALLVLLVMLLYEDQMRQEVLQLQL